MQWNDAQSPLLIIFSLLIALQIGWIAAMLQRNKRRHLGEPLSATAFQRELDRIFSRSNELF